MANKKGWLRIVEASIAIIIVLSIVLIMYDRRKVSIESDLAERITPLLDEIARNATMRGIILKDNATMNEAENLIIDFLSKRIMETYIGYNVSVHNLNESSALQSYPAGVSGSMYAGDRIISSVLESETFAPKRVKLFLWVKK